MEKLIYLLWNRADRPVEAWRSAMLNLAGGRLVEAGARGLQFNLVDSDVARGTGLRIVTQPPPDGFVAFWLPTANRRAAAESILADSHARIAGYLVSESTILPGVGRRGPGRRSDGFSLIGFLQRPSRLTKPEWLKIWLGSHTDVAVETQSTFRYIQNVVTRRLTDDPPPLDALVEEGFPTEALDSPQAFYDAVGDEAKYRHHLKRMMDSCHRFIDFDRINSLPTSEYVIAD